MLILTQRELERSITMKEAIVAVEEGFAEYARGTAMMPLRTILELPEQDGRLLTMPAYLSQTGALTVKIVALFNKNPARFGLPSIAASILLTDSSTGQPLALLEGGFLTAMRTGAASGVATKYLASPQRKIVGVFGAGVQARTQLWAVHETRGVEEAYVYAPNAKAAAAFAAEMEEKLGVKVITVDRAETAVAKSDLIITATTAKTPVLFGAWLQPGVHVNAVGWMGPTARELDTVTIQRSKLVVDSRQAVLAESGDILIPIQEGAITANHIFAEIGEIVAGRKAGRTTPDEITLWKSVGLAIQDAAIAQLAYERARAHGLGVEVKLT